MSDILCITNRGLCKENFLSRIRKVAAEHPAGIILREKDLDETEYKILAESVMKICSEYGTPCSLHNYVKAAVELGCQSIHLPLPTLRKMTDQDKAKFHILGASCHSVEDAIEAEKLGCTYITAGHVFDTDCKKGLPGRGIRFLNQVCESVSIPVYAIGGIKPENMDEIRTAGASGACVMSGAMICDDPGEYLAAFEEKKMNFNKDMLLLYAVTDRNWVGRQSLYEQVEDALKGGVTIVQLREKNFSEEAFLSEAIQIKELCHRYNVPFIINDNLDVAIKSGADGIHVGTEDVPVEEIRKKVGKDFIIGATAKTVVQAQAAERAGADYIGVGAVFPSPTKETAIRITKEQLKEICSTVSIPAVAIGGITYENICEIQGSGMDGIAVVSAIFAAEDIQAAAFKMKEMAKKVIGHIK